MLDLDTVRYNLERWIETFVEVPHPALGGWAPCPYARQARLNREYDVRVGTSLTYDLIKLSQEKLGGKKVVILAYEPGHYTSEQFDYLIDYVNHLWLRGQDLIALADHPADAEVVNGVAMNQGTYALVLVQSLSDLDQKARLVAQKDFYATWPEQYLRILFKGRQDPRL